MIIINEFLANPKGKDSGFEWIELKNTGVENQNIEGWRVDIGLKKHISLSGKIESGGFKVLDSKSYHFSLKNTEETVTLRDAKGVVQDAVKMIGKAPDGKSFGRTPSGEIGFLTPTPAASNPEREKNTATTETALENTPINRIYSSVQVHGAALTTAIVIALAVLYILRWNEKNAHTNPFAPSDKE